MEGLTLMVAALGVVIVLAAKPVKGFIAFLAVLLLYPDYLRVSLGSVDISACRIIVTILLFRCITDSRVMNQFHWKTLDTLVLGSMVVYCGALSFTMPVIDMLENRAGFIMDTWFVYMATRLVIVDRDSAVTVAKAVSIMVVFLAVHGVVETFTGKSLYVGLGQYCPWANTKGMAYQERYGLNRAMGPPGETILFGLSFASLVPFIWMLRHEPGSWGRWAYVLTCFCIVGVASTVSSGPYLALFVVLGCLALERAKYLVKPLIILFFVACVAIELLSNRHFYNVLADMTMDPISGWYRARLLEVAVIKLPEYWMFGYGYEDPGWGPMINMLPWTDVVNDLVMHAILYGIFGLGIYVAILVRSVYDVARSYSLTQSPWVKSFGWATVSSLMGLFFAFWSVSLFGQMINQFYFLLGLHGALAVRAAAVNSAARLTPQINPGMVRMPSPLMPSQAR